jgi:hypothetical protein
MRPVLCFLVALPRIASGPADTDDDCVVALLQRMPPAAVVALLAALLNERHIVVTARRLCDVSVAVRACQALLGPFTWQHLLIPILPASMLDYAAAPMPFIIGLQVPLLAAVSRLQLPVEHLVILDADSGTVEGADDDAADMPVAPVAQLQQSLASLSASSGASATTAIARFYSQCLGAWPDFIRTVSAASLAPPDGALRVGPCWFDHEAYAASARSKTGLAHFRSVLRQSQLFEALVTARMDAIAEALAAAPPAVPPVLTAAAGTVVQTGRVADLLAQARSGYRQLRDAEDVENAATTLSSRAWLQRRPLSAVNGQLPAPALPSKATAAADAEQNRALVEAAVQCWQQCVSRPLREALLSAAPAAAASSHNADAPKTLDAAAPLIARLRQEAASLRLERCAALALICCCVSMT